MAFTLSKEFTNEYNEAQEMTEQQSIESLKASAKDHLLFIRNMYIKQKTGIPIRIKKRRTEMIGATMIFLLVIAIAVAAICIFNLIGVILCAFMCWAIFFTIRDFVKAVMRYLILTEHKAAGFYRRRVDIFTYVSEERFCNQKIKEINEMINNIDELQAGDVEECCTKLLTYQYQEKRAEAVFGSADERLI